MTRQATSVPAFTETLHNYAIVPEPGSNGTHFEINLGDQPQGAYVTPVNLAVLNLARSAGESLGGWFQIPAAADFTVSGGAAFYAVTAGSAGGSIQVVADTHDLGVHTQDIVLHSFEMNAAGKVISLPDITLSITEDVVYAGPLHAPPASALLGAALQSNA